MKQFDTHRFARSIQRQMSESGLTTRPAAKKIGISPATLNRLVNGVFLPDINTLFAVCKWLGRGMEFFYTNKKKDETNKN